ncbi:MAG TPA: ankyrin repeat domain-containing protein [Gemmataceae bacterium]|nr:ankyrin repeat domain-containing protein [Gemmataceae bacterium]
MFRRVTPLLLLFACLPLIAPAAQPDDDLIAAAKQGDADAVKTLLDGGADVNAKNPYGATALHFAADKGYIEVVKVLLKHKADVNVKDTFYKASPLDWAVMRGRTEVVGALLEAGADGAGDALQAAAAKGQADLVRVILDKGKPKAEELAKALAATPAESAEIAKLLKDAGAKPAAGTAATADADLLAAYAGAYRSDDGLEIKIAVAGGKLSASFGAGAPAALSPADKDGFKADDGSFTAAFRREWDKVSGLTVTVNKKDTVFLRVEAPKEPAPGTAAVEDRGGVVKAPLNWPQFRGPNASGVADGQFPPLVWDANRNVNIRWKTPIPGLGHSCPIVWGDRVYVTTAVSAGGEAEFRPGLYGDVDSAKESSEQSWRVFCIDRRDGKVVWERTACSGVPKVKRHPKASHANPTPATDGDYVVASFGSEGLYCFDRDGKLLWQ